MSDGESPDLQAVDNTKFKRLAVVVGVAVAILALVALASRANLSDLSADPQDPDETSRELERSSEPGQQPGSFDPRFPPDGQIDLGGGESLEVREIPGCPGGIRIGDVLIVPDPEACGFRPLEPGERAVDSGLTILTPDPQGSVGGFRIAPDGSVELLAPGEAGAGDYFMIETPGGNFGLVRPDGSIVEIFPGDGDGDLRTEDPGFYDPNLETPAVPDVNELPDSQESAPDDNDAADTDDADNGDGFEWSTPLIVLLAVIGVALLGLILYSLLSGREPSTDDDTDDDESNDDPDDDDEALQDSVRGPRPYAEQLSALDRLLWEIDQEPDPRRAIRRVYAALETGLDNPAMARGMSETPGIYLRRVLGRFDELDVPLRELTHLFEMARFSNHEMTQDMRNHAVTNLVAVRSYYASQAGAPTAGMS